MKSDWTQTLKQKLAENTVAPPDDLWADISTDLDAALATRGPRRQYSLWRWCAAAATLLVAIFGCIYLITNSTDSDTPTPIIADSDQEPVQTVDRQETAPTIPDAKAYTPKTTYKLHRPTATTTDSETIYEDVSVTGQYDNVEAESLAAIAETQDSVSNEPIDYERLLMAMAEKEQHVVVTATDYHKRVSIGIYASNTNMPDFGNFVEQSFVCNWGGPHYDDFGYTNNGYSEIFTGLNTSNAACVLDAKHKQPIRFGLSARYPVSKSLSVSAGMTYSRLSSTLTWMMNGGGTYDTDQTLHYIGIPVSADFSLISNQSVSVYLTGGAMVEKCIDGQIKTSNTKIKHLSENALQTSLFAGTGLQYNFNRHIGIYAEPVVTYYIDNHSDIVNIYKDRKLNLDLRLGLRYTVK